MSEPKGYESIEAALLAVGTCLADLSIPAQDNPEVDLPVSLHFGDVGSGAVLDCCPNPLLKIESAGELPAQGLPITLSKHGCVDFVESIVVTFLTCWTNRNKQGGAATVGQLAYSRTIMNKRWEAVLMLRCCLDSRIRFVSSSPIETDGKCAGFDIRLAAPVSLCGPCPSPVVSS
jgi:hypothetical protein